MFKKSRGYKKITDVDIIVNDNIIYKLNKYVLQDAEYFYYLFSEFPENNVYNINIPVGITEYIFEKIIKYLYDNVNKDEKDYNTLREIFFVDGNIMDNYKYIRYFGILTEEEEEELLEILLNDYIIYQNKDKYDILKIGILYNSDKIIKKFFEMSMVYCNLKENRKVLSNEYNIEFDRIDNNNLYTMRIYNGVELEWETEINISDDRIDKIKLNLNYYKQI
jgi:hypothetical protein